MTYIITNKLFISYFLPVYIAFIDIKYNNSRYSQYKMHMPGQTIEKHCIDYFLSALFGLKNNRYNTYLKVYADKRYLY